LTDTGFAASVRRIVPLAWPVFVGQVAVLGFGTVDTIIVGRSSSLDLAALAVGQAAYVTTFIGLMGVVLALGPIVGQLHGARQPAAAGRQVHQALWIALALALAGCALLVFPAPFIALTRASPEVEPKVRGYLLALAFSLPASLLFTIFRGFNVAVSRPKAVMTLQLAGLALKVPLSTALVAGVPALGVPALGVIGCGIATGIAMWLQVAAAAWVLARDPFYAPFALGGRPGLGIDAPDRKALTAQLRLGLPMGATILVEVTGFTFMALFIARLGTEAVAGHQIAANLAALLFMLALGIGNATGTLVAQRIGARDFADAARLGWHGIALAALLALSVGGALVLLRAPIVGLYTKDAAVAAVALPLVLWVALFHVADAVQAVAAFVLRGWRVATVPLLIYVVGSWVIGLGGGVAVAFDDGMPAPLRGASGFWALATLGVVAVAAALVAFLAWMLRERKAGG
jgi:MATE family multidrug resistance protein